MNLINLFKQNVNAENLYYKDKVTEISISTDTGLELYQHWMEQAYSSFLASIAQQKFYLIFCSILIYLD